MTATIATLSDRPSADRTGLVRQYDLAAVGTGDRHVLTLWSAPPAGPAGRRYLVSVDWPGPAADQEPAVATVLTFPGPVGDRGHLAHARSWDRIEPALATVVEAVGSLRLTDPDGDSLLVVNLATTMAGLRAIGTAVHATDLLPDEDPALLTGPSRIEFHVVTPPVLVTSPVPVASTVGGIR